MTTDLDEVTPWGFTVGEAFALFRERADLRRATDKMRERRRGLWSDEHPCRYPSCGAPVQRGRDLCPPHSDLRLRLREKKAERKRAAQESREARRRYEAAHKRCDGCGGEFDPEGRPFLYCTPCRTARAERVPAPRRYDGPPRRGYVYRLFDADGALLYVGKTYDVTGRLFGPRGHRETKRWFSDVARVAVTVYATEDSALAAEAWAIRREAPLHNIAQPEPWTTRAPRSLARVSGAI